MMKTNKASARSGIKCRKNNKIRISQKQGTAMKFKHGDRAKTHPTIANWQPALRCIHGHSKVAEVLRTRTGSVTQRRAKPQPPPQVIEPGESRSGATSPVCKWCVAPSRKWWNRELGRCVGRSEEQCAGHIYAFPFLLLLNEGNYIQELVSLIDFRTWNLAG